LKKKSKFFENFHTYYLFFWKYQNFWHFHQHSLNVEYFSVFSAIFPTQVPSDPQASDSGLEVANSDVDKHFEEARQRSLNALKTSFAKQRNKGLLTDEAVTVLRQAVDSVQNDPSSVQFVSINQLKRNWKLFGIIPKFKNMIETHLYGNNEKEIRNPWRKRWVRKCHKEELETWRIRDTLKMLRFSRN